MEGVTDAQKKKIQKLIDAKQAGVDATKKSYKSSTIPTMRGTEEDKEQAKKLKEYQYGKKLLKRADKREKKAGGSVKKKMAMGGKMKPVDKKKNPGLAKLPTEVRNKMGFMKKGGMAKKKMMGGGMTIKKMKHGGKAGKCPRDGIAMKGKTRAGR
jgi:archaellum component FlaD/FlaE